MHAKSDTRPVAVMLGGPIACSSGALTGEACLTRAGAYEAIAGQDNTLAGYLAQRSRERREAGHSNPDLTLASLGRPGGKRAAWRGQSGWVVRVTANYADPGKQTFASGDGTFSTGVPEALTVAEIEQVGCFPASFPYNSPKGEFPMFEERPLGYTVTRFEAQAAGG